MGSPVLILFTLHANLNVPKINTDFSVTETMDDCKEITVCDITPDYSLIPDAADKFAGVEFYMKAPDSETEVLIDKNFIPDFSNDCAHGCFTVTCEDYAAAMADGQIIPSPVQDDCGCGSTDSASSANQSCFQDGCWKLTYKVYFNANVYVYKMDGFAGGNYSVIINSISHSLGYIGNIATLVTALNQLKMGKFVYDMEANTITVTYWNMYGNISNETLTFSPVLLGQVKTLAGEKTKNTFFSCNVLSRIKAVALRGFSDNCDCYDVPSQAQINALFNGYQIMILAAKDSGCNCECAQQYLCILDKMLSKTENNCNQ